MPRQPTMSGLPDLSTAHWLVLTLVIEKHSYGYEIAARYDRRFGTFLPTSRTAIYSALDRLQNAELVESKRTTLKPASGSPRMPSRVIYTPTQRAKPTHETWLGAPIRASRWREEMLARVGSAHIHGPTAADQTLQKYLYYAERHQKHIQQLLQERSAASQNSLRTLLPIKLLQEQQAATTAHIAWAKTTRHAVTQPTDDQ
jgi:DNA-binding PadR family transcriptional regulator